MHDLLLNLTKIILLWRYKVMGNVRTVQAFGGERALISYKVALRNT